MERSSRGHSRQNSQADASRSEFPLVLQKKTRDFETHGSRVTALISAAFHFEGVRYTSYCICEVGVVSDSRGDAL